MNVRVLHGPTTSIVIVPRQVPCAITLTVQGLVPQEASAQ